MAKFANSIDKKKAPVYPMPRMATLPIMMLPQWPDSGVYFSWEGERDGSESPEELAQYLNKWHSKHMGRYKDNSHYYETIAMVARVGDNIAESLYGFRLDTINLIVRRYKDDWSVTLRVQSQKAHGVELTLPATDQDHAERLRAQLMDFVALYPVMDLDVWTLYAEEVGGVIEWG